MGGHSANASADVILRVTVLKDKLRMSGENKSSCLYFRKKSRPTNALSESSESIEREANVTVSEDKPQELKKVKRGLDS